MFGLTQATAGTARYERRRSIAVVFAGLLIFNASSWLWALLAFRRHSLLLGAAVMAYGFGLRHAFDADHIAAIDNVTRKLMQEHKRPITVGLFFALGHSTIVALATAAFALTVARIGTQFGRFAHGFGSLIGTSVSAAFLFAIALANLAILSSVWTSYRQVRAGATPREDEVDQMLNRRGGLARLLRPLFRLIRHSWQMYPLGFLFGLGFDTATEVALLGVAATAASKGAPWSIIMVFPALFAAGMTLMDTTDGVLMLGAYDWACADPMRKLRYNLAITSVSVAIALLIGTMETLGLLSDRMHLRGPLPGVAAYLDRNFGALGLGILLAFVAGWIGSVVVQVRRRRHLGRCSGARS